MKPNYAKTSKFSGKKTGPVTRAASRCLFPARDPDDSISTLEIIGEKFTGKRHLIVAIPSGDFDTDESEFDGSFISETVETVEVDLDETMLLGESDDSDENSISTPVETFGRRSDSISSIRSTHFQLETHDE